MSIKFENTLLEINEKIKREAENCGKKLESPPAVVAISKTFGAESILPLLEHGHKLFGENKVQEAKEKWPALKDRFPETKLHLVGPLQTNKTKEAIEIFDVIESLDREKLARCFAKERDNGAKLPDLLIQVNTGAEEQKAGILPEDADEFISLCAHELNLPVKGLMCIPPKDEEPSPHFALLKKIADRNGLKILSMGMSSDYGIAAAMGATHVRIGRAIFGERS